MRWRSGPRGRSRPGKSRKGAGKTAPLVRAAGRRPGGRTGEGNGSGKGKSKGKRSSPPPLGGPGQWARKAASTARNWAHKGRSFFAQEGWANRVRVGSQLLIRYPRLRIAGVALVAALALVVLASLLTRPNAVAVEVAGRTVGVVGSEAEVKQAVAELERELTAQGWVEPENCRELSLVPVRVPAAQVVGPAELKEALRRALAFTVQAAAIRVDGKIVAWVRDRQVAEKVLDEVKEAYLAGEGKVLEVDTEEEVKVESGEVLTSEVVAPETAVQLLREGVPYTAKYTVAAGDSLWSIARAHGTSVEELRAANPQLQGDFLQIGDELRLVRVEPPLHCVVTREVQEEERIPYPVEIR